MATHHAAIQLITVIREVANVDHILSFPVIKIQTIHYASMEIAYVPSRLICLSAEMGQQKAHVVHLYTNATSMDNVQNV